MGKLNRSSLNLISPAVGSHWSFYIHSYFHPFLQFFYRVRYSIFLFTYVFTILFLLRMSSLLRISVWAFSCLLCMQSAPMLSVPQKHERYPILFIRLAGQYCSLLWRNWLLPQSRTVSKCVPLQAQILRSSFPKGSTITPLAFLLQCLHPRHQQQRLLWSLRQYLWQLFILPPAPAVASPLKALVTTEAAFLSFQLGHTLSSFDVQRNSTQLLR